MSRAIATSIQQVDSAHLMVSYGMTPDAYRERWGLPPDYPMVAPSHSERRSTLAKTIGLGRKPGKAKAAE